MTNKDHIERTKRMIEVMQAYVDGEEIECETWPGFYEAVNKPIWNIHNYRIAKTPDTINWDHVAPEFKYMARDEDGRAWLYQNEPILSEEFSQWEDEAVCCSNSAAHSSYRRGTVDWKDSLVIRPGFE